ncbi:MAG TPA: flagellar basal body L-ring protein FlgH [Candidatus Cybelea sp.]|nr:flagellar basal body L-ring protein FlgH [Candidatus Cybelea sp.]
MSRRFVRVTLATVLAATLGACGNVAERLATVGEEPKMSKIEDPTAQRDYKPVQLPMPRPEPLVRQANSLWRPGARQFFKDQRAAKVGDILTVTVAVADQAQVADTTTRSRTNSENANATNFLGAETPINGQSTIGRILHGANPASLINLGSAGSSSGAGTVQRQETINLKVAALVTQVLPNGNMVIYGRQEVRVNFEVRELEISGVVRPEDITSTNTINHSQIAEARIVYGGRGQLTDVQQPRYGQQVFDVLFPF